ncbi:MAG: YqgE/AlgH family protein [Desulfobacterales bacterium]
MPLDETDCFKGHFLLAMPGLKDPNFNQTVTCLCEHTSQGAFGLVVNRHFPSLLLSNVFEELKIEFQPEVGQGPVYIGGPVRMDEIFVLHGPPLTWKGTLGITPQLAITNTKDILKAIAQGEGPSDFLLTLGCAGWGPGQLESEVLDNAWLNQPADPAIIFRTPIDARWERAIKNLGIDPHALSQTAGHA